MNEDLFVTKQRKWDLKKVAADKGKEQEIMRIEETEDTRMDRLEEELQGLREKLAYADKQIIDTKLIDRK